jgi:hypothetical protein
MRFLQKPVREVASIYFDPVKKDIVAPKRDTNSYEILAKDKERDANFHIATAKVHVKDQSALELPEVE